MHTANDNIIHSMGFVVIATSVDNCTTRL